jgi:hypothetical protein
MPQKVGEALARWHAASPEERAELTEARRERMREAWQMKVCEGKTYKEIAKHFDLSPQAIMGYVSEVAQEMLELDYGSLPQIRAREVARLEHITDNLMPLVNQNDMEAIKVLNTLSIQKSRLLGLYAPVKVKMEHTSARTNKDASRDEIDRRLVDLYLRLKRRGKEMSPELERWAQEHKDIVDGEIVKVEEKKT